MPSNGSFWYGKGINFPGFLFKKNTGVGARRSTQFTPGGTALCNQPVDLNNRYIPGSGVGGCNISVRRHKTRLAANCCNIPKYPEYPVYPTFSGTFIYSFRFVGTLPSNQSNKMKLSRSGLSGNDLLVSDNSASMYDYIKQYLPLSTSDNMLKYTYYVHMDIDNNVTVKIIYTFKNDPTTTDGLQFSLDNKYTLQNFYNTETRDLTVEQFGNIPLSRYTTAFDKPSGRQFSELDITILNKDSPTILSDTNLSFCFSNLQNNANFNSDLSKWKVIGAIDMNNMFAQAYLVESDLSGWKVNNVTDMNNMFYNCFFFNSNLPWNTSNVTNMESMFQNARRFDGDISTFDISKVKSMDNMFNGAFRFNNSGQPIKWINKRTSLVNTMNYLFKDCLLFDQEIPSYLLSNVTSIISMFEGALLFNNGDKPLYWAKHTQNITSMKATFKNAYKFNQKTFLDVTNVSSMESMFMCGTGGFFSQFRNSSFNNGGYPIYWIKNSSNISNNMSYMFYNANLFDQPIPGNLFSGVTSMNSMFYSADVSSIFNQSVSDWDVSSVTDMGFLFFGAKLFDQTVNDWDVSSVTDMSYMFSRAFSFNNGGVKLTWGDKSRNVTLMESMFSADSGGSQFNQNISELDVSGVTSMNGMFNGSGVFNNGGEDLIWGDKTQNLTSINEMFQGYYEFIPGIFNQKIIWNTSNVTSMDFTFAYSSFNQNISYWDVSRVTSMNSTFSYSSFNNGGDILDWGDKTQNITSLDSIFEGNTSFDQDITNWDVSNVISMISTFSYSNFNNGGKNLDWGDKTANVQRMSGMFYGANVIPGGIGGWNVSSVSSMNSMFRFANNSNNNLLDLSLWNLQENIQLREMFGRTNNFNVKLNNVKSSRCFAIFAGSTNLSGLFLNWHITPSTSSNFPPQFFSGSTDFNADLSGWIVEQSNFSNLFGNTTNFNGKGLTTWQINPTTFSQLFQDPIINFQSDLSGWGNQLSNLSDMSRMFSGDLTGYNILGLDTWDTSNVSNMENCFAGTYGYASFINEWNVSKVKIMKGLFYNASNLICDLSGWDVSNVDDMSDFFNSTSNFSDSNIGNISGWQIPKLTNIQYIFANTQNFSLNSIAEWDISDIKDISYLFSGATSFNVDLKWDVSKVQNFTGIFANTVNFNNRFVETWNLESATTMGGMFSGSDNFSCNLSLWNFPNCTRFDYMFGRPEYYEYSITNFNGQGLKMWNTSKVESYVGLFANIKDFTGLSDISSWNTVGATDFSYLFYRTDSLHYDPPELFGWNVKNVEKMSHFFDGAENFELDLSAWGDQLTKLRDLSYALANQIAFDNRSIEGWTIDNVENLSGLFSLTEDFYGKQQTTGVTIDFSYWDPVSVTDASRIFSARAPISPPSPIKLVFQGTGLETWRMPELETFEYAFEGTDGLDARFFANLIPGDRLLSLKGLAYNTNDLKLDVSTWRTQELQDFSEAFYIANNTQQILGLQALQLEKVETLDLGFANSLDTFDLKENPINPIFLESKSFPNLTSAIGLAINNQNFNVDMTVPLQSANQIITLAGAFKGAKKYPGLGLALGLAVALTFQLEDISGIMEGATDMVPSLANMKHVELAPGAIGANSAFTGTIYQDVVSLRATPPVE
jgi:hypothetical protein